MGESHHLMVLLVASGEKEQLMVQLSDHFTRQG